MLNLTNSNCYYFGESINRDSPQVHVVTAVKEKQTLVEADAVCINSSNLGIYEMNIENTDLKVVNISCDRVGS